MVDVVRIRVDPERCSGHGRCYVLSPRLFSPDEQGYPNLLGRVADVPPELPEDAMIAIRACPEGAIHEVE